MFLSTFIETLAYALIQRYPYDFFAQFVITFLDPFYQWAQRIETQARLILPF
ncbi:MAG: hypothetical protein U1A27_08080 [Phycisphaerae bacterium]